MKYQKHQFDKCPQVGVNGSDFLQKEVGGTDMRNIAQNVWRGEEYSYPMAMGFAPNYRGYLHEDEEIRPCMVVVPGGGYCVVSPTEGEIVAKKFYEYGFNAFVVTYTTNLLMRAPLKDQPMKDLSRAIRMIRSRAGEYHIDPQRLALCGFSAGGHLCGSICVHYDDITDPDEVYQAVSNRPDAAILSYPVITFGEKTHQGSVQALLGDQPTDAELEYHSLEKQVKPTTPPCFLWQTVTDETVPVENSYLFAEACRKQGVLHAHHVFSEGRHGLSLADEDWANGRFGEPYPLEQVFLLQKAVQEGNLQVPEESKEMLNMFSMDGFPAAEPNPEVSVWPGMAVQWLRGGVWKR